MSLLSRIQRGVRVGLQAARGAPDLDTVALRLSELEASGALDHYLIEKEVEKEGNKTFLNVHKTSQGFINFHSLLTSAVRKNDLPPHGDPTRDLVLAEFWKDEPLLAGAVYSMSAKMTSLSWTVVGKSDEAKHFANIFASGWSMDGQDWGSFISPSTQDFYTTDRGVFWETPRVGHRVYGRLDSIGHIDALQCAMTGNSKKPVFYLSDVTGQDRFFRPGEFIHFASLTSAREGQYGMGFCASSRAWKAAKLLLGLHQYDEEKLANLPPEGVAAVSGLTMDEFQDALAIWKAAREKNNSLTFPQVLWLIASQPGASVNVDFVGFSQMPESFNREIVVQQYINTLALDFGVDAREFWPISSGTLGTASESEVQHMKAKGKGPGEFVSIVERKLNAEMPEGVDFSFDTQDIAEDQQAAETAKTWIEALLPLVTGGSPGGPKMGETEKPTGGNGEPALDAAGPVSEPGGQESIISKQEFLRLLADRGVLPNYIVGDSRVVVTDSGIMEKEYSEYVMFRYKAGVLTAERLPSYTVRDVPKVQKPIELPPPSKNGNLTSNFTTDELSETFSWIKEIADDLLEGRRSIRGKPISEREALRGDRATKAAIKAELERWRKHPILRDYAPTVDEEQEVIESVQ